MKEICICAAVKTTTGQVFRGHRHVDCFAAIKGRKLNPSRNSEDQGFITSNNRYVGRVEGFDLQIKANIKSVNTDFITLKTGYCREGELYSEDLY